MLVQYVVAIQWVGGEVGSGAAAEMGKRRSGKGEGRRKEAGEGWKRGGKQKETGDAMNQIPVLLLKSHHSSFPLLVVA